MLRTPARTRTRTAPWYSDYAAAAVIALLGAWVFFVPLVGPYFSFGFFTDSTWVFSGRHWELLLAPGIAAGIAGLLLAVPSPVARSVVSMLALLTGVWLLIGPSLYPIWGSDVTPIDTDQPKQALLWIGYFYGPGALITYLTGYLHGVVRPRGAERVEPVVGPEPVAPAEEPHETGVDERRTAAR
jgi:hypothetical protein